MPTKHNPTPEERDDRVSLPLDPLTAVEAILATGPHSEEDQAEDRPELEELEDRPPGAH
ncbi:MAG TPA: hypothetical protein VGR26_17105 [Acidimicrobiales bacterium]|nr:hypothetical protein [Acidimicrobiales bacterium]